MAELHRYHSAPAVPVRALVLGLRYSFSTVRVARHRTIGLGQAPSRCLTSCPEILGRPSCALGVRVPPGPPSTQAARR